MRTPADRPERPPAVTTRQVVLLYLGTRFGPGATTCGIITTLPQRKMLGPDAGIAGNSVVSAMFDEENCRRGHAT